MARNKLSLPHERRKARLIISRQTERIRIAESKERLAKVNVELNAMKPKKKEPI